MLGAGAFSACIAPNQTRARAQLASDLADLAAAKDLAAAGLIVVRGDEVVAEGAVGASGGLDRMEADHVRPFTVDTPFRVASQSKAATALTALRLQALGAIDLDMDVSPELGFPLHHPDAVDQPISLNMLLSHTSGIRDPAAYWIASPGRIASLVTPDIFRPLDGRSLLGHFEYANLNYGLAATALESASGERFDRLAQRLVFGPAGLDVGFNWSGVSVDRRRSGGTLYRRDEVGRWAIQTDGPDSLIGNAPTVLLEAGFELERYERGSNGTLFSPQGGLRASLRDLAKLARLYARTPEMMAARWRLDDDGSNGQHNERFFQAMGLGLMSYPASESPFRGYEVFGHHGEAYGLLGAFWIVPDADIVLAYAAIGVPETRHPAVRHQVSKQSTAGTEPGPR
ncbi:MAG: serine hydrolase domain-containing protein [Pseudomonadota bacterium]